MSRSFRIRVDHRHNLVVPLGGMEFVHIVGVAKGVVWSFGSSFSKSGAHQRLTWPDLRCPVPGTVSVALGEFSPATEPERTETIQDKSAEEAVVGLLEELRAIERQFGSNSPSTNNQVHQRVSRVVFATIRENGEKVAEIASEHIQFELNYKDSHEPILVVFGEPRTSSKGEMLRYQFIIKEGADVSIRLRS